MHWEQLTLGGGAVEVRQSEVRGVSHSPKHLLQPGVSNSRIGTWAAASRTGPTSSATASGAASSDIVLAVFLRKDDTNTNSNSRNDEKNDKRGDDLRRRQLSLHKLGWSERYVPQISNAFVVGSFFRGQHSYLMIDIPTCRRGFK